MSRARLTDIAIALLIAVLFAESPFTPDDVGPSIAMGTVAGLLFLWYRSTHRPSAAPGEDAREATGGFLRALAATPILVWLSVVVWIALFAPTLSLMYDRWTASFWQNNHSLIVAVLMVLLATSALRRQHRERRPYDPSAWGFVLIAAGASLAVVDAGMQTLTVSAVGFVISLPGMVLLLLGRSRARALALPMAMGFFLIPLPNLITGHLYLRSLTASATLWLLQTFGVRASLYHSQLELPGQVFNVSEACSGFSTLVAAIALSLFLVSLCPSPRRRVLLLLAILPLTLAANTLRVALLVVLSMGVGVEVLDTMVHEASGVATFVVVIGSLFWIADRPRVAEAFR